MVPSQRVLYSVDQAATLLTISRAQLYRLIDKGELESVQIGRSRRISQDQLDRFVKGLEQKCNIHPLRGLPQIRDDDSLSQGY